MNIPLYHEIDELLAANKAGHNSQLPDFYICQLAELDNYTHDIEMPAHRTDFFGITMFLRGEGKMTINSDSADYSVGMLAFTSPGQVISWEKKAELDGFLIFFKASFLSQFQFKTVAEEFPYFGLDANVMVLLGTDCQQFTNYFELIVTEYKLQHPNYENVIRSYLLLVLHLFKRNCEGKNENKEQNSRKMQVTKAFEALVRKDLPNRKSIKEYADLLFMSEKHFIELIKEGSGKTPLEFVQDIYLNEAKTLLTHTPLSISEIAYRLNFQDPSYFNKVFKKHFQITPLAFRNGR